MVRTTHNCNFNSPCLDRKSQCKKILTILAETTFFFVKFCYFNKVDNGA